MKEIKPIAMRCTEEQFDAIKPKLEKAGLVITSMESFLAAEYLVNNFRGDLGIVTNLINFRGDLGIVTNLISPHGYYERLIFEEWDEQTFLEYCGIESFVLPEKWCVEITESNREVLLNWVRKQPNYNNYGEHCFYPGNTAVSKHPFDDTYLYVYSPSDFLKAHPKYKQITFQEFEKHVLKQEHMETIKVSAAQVLRIHEIACQDWQARIVKDYLPRINKNQEIEFTRSEVDEMFRAAIPKQVPTLESIFGVRRKPIEWDKIKTGSKVMIQYTGEHCSGIKSIDLSKPVDVVFYKTPHLINDDAVFKRKSNHASYCTFFQHGKYVVFSAEKNVDYITEVIEY
jgi:hypothetical protein